MAVTKTNFINYTRCRRYVSLENLKREKLDSKLSIEEYIIEEKNEEKRDLLGSLFEMQDGEELDVTKKVDKQLEAMMDYYNEVESLAALHIENIFGGKSIYSKETYNQESFDFSLNGIRYLCYVDIYNESSNEINIIEVKATTSKKYVDLDYGLPGKDKYPMFIKGNKDVYSLSLPVEDDEKVLKSYNSKKAKLKNRFSDVGKYVYDLCVQRYIIENDFKNNNVKTKVNYYLAMLNTNYVYDGYRENGKRVYRTIDGEDIISVFDLTDLTSEMMDSIDLERERLEEYIYSEDNSIVKYSQSCELKKNTECIYKPICYKNVPSTNTSYNYLNFRSFKDGNGVTYNKYDLLNDGYLKLDDIPVNWLKNKNHIIQRNCYDNNEEYINTEKIGKALDNMEYPIYHLDFESFPCPIPRFRGEKPYSQSCFEFSLHIEHSPGECDKDADNYVFLAETEEDEREEMVKQLVNRIDVNKGTMLAQNVSFENGRLKELAEIFPQYKKHLLKIVDMSYDLLYLIRNKKELYLDLGFNIEEANTINYYNKKLSGSYSIKKTLPLFSDLTYQNLEIANGTEALVEYSRYHLMSKEELNETRKHLIVYCKQDTWAMVEILNGLRAMVNKCQIMSN